MNLATLLRYVNLKDSRYWEERWYIMSDYQLMAEKLGFGLCAIVNDINLEQICDQCDGLLLPGSGMDINPKYYGGPDIPPTVDEYALDSKLIRYFYEHNKPIFGICGGHQELNIFFGGTIKRLDDPVGHHTECRHDINVKKGSFVWDVFGSERVNVNCFHGWELGELAPCFDVVATTDDGVAEAIEWKEKNIFATQWHPERSFHDSWENTIEQKFFENFLEICRQNAK